MMVLPCVCVLLLFDVVHALSYASTNDIMGGIMLQASTPRQVALALVNLPDHSHPPSHTLSMALLKSKEREGSS